MAIDIEVATKDCTALTDAELAEMADLSAGERAGWEVGFLSKQREDWVLVTQVREEGKLQGYALATLERIGGTPSLLIGVAAFTKGRNASVALDAAMRDLYRRAVLAFPDEDVLVGTRFAAGLRLSRLCGSRGHRPPPRPPGDGRGACLGPAARQAFRGGWEPRRPDLRAERRRGRSGPARLRPAEAARRVR